MVERPEIISDNLIWVIPAEGIRLAKAPGPVLGAFAFIAFIVNRLADQPLDKMEKILPHAAGIFPHMILRIRRWAGTAFPLMR